MKVFETQLPGEGIRYTVQFDGGGRLVVVNHNSGTREVYWAEKGDRDSEKLFEVTAEQGHRIADILNGTYFYPVDDTPDNVLEDARIRWVEIPSDSSVDGKSIGDIGIRSKTGVTVLAIQRNGETITDPGAADVLRAEDVLVTVGPDGAHTAFRNLLDDSR